MRNPSELKALADQHGIKTYRRMFIDVREGSQLETKFIDVPLSAKDLAQELRERGLL